MVLQATEELDLLVEALRLTGSELVHAAIVGVIHEVVNGIGASGVRAGLGVVGGASKGSILLGGSVSDLITLTVASTLEGVVETDPVANFVGQGLMELLDQLGKTEY